MPLLLLQSQLNSVSQVYPHANLTIMNLLRLFSQPILLLCSYDFNNDTLLTVHSEQNRKESTHFLSTNIQNIKESDFILIKLSMQSILIC
jgi:hypothetical protein